jgi:hypothetical protein
MANCCRNNWAICEPIVGCCALFNIGVPNEYEGETVIIKIKKPSGYTFTGVFDVEDGIVQIDALDEMPQGFLNAWGGPYTLQFIDPANNSIVWFDVNGEPVQGVEWNMAYGTGQEICGLDIYA